MYCESQKEYNMLKLMTNKYDFAAVYADCKDNVWRLVSKFVFTLEDREDLFQEIFLKVHKALPRFRGESEVNTWVHKITVNTAINYVKKRDRYRWIKEKLGGFRAVEEAPPEVTTDVQMFKPLGKLNEQQRMILLLSDIEEKTLDEIASIMNLPLGTVKSNLFRAREIIKKEVNKNGGL